MGTSWQLQHAKNRFSEVVERALTEGPQTVTRHGEEVVVVLSVGQYREILDRSDDFKEFLRAAPLEGVDLARDQAPDRDVDLPDLE